MTVGEAQLALPSARTGFAATPRELRELEKSQICIQGAEVTLGASGLRSTDQSSTSRSVEAEICRRVGDGAGESKAEEWRQQSGGFPRLESGELLREGTKGVLR